MIIAALICFAILLVAWLVAPAASTESPAVLPMPADEALAEAA
jgi:hypothetical protein